MTEKKRESTREREDRLINKLDEKNIKKKGVISLW